MRPLLATRFKIIAARFLYRITRLIYHKDVRIIKRSGITYEIDLSEGIELSLFLFGKFQHHVIKNRFLQLHEDAIVLDVGANVGVMSLQFAKKLGRGRVYAFEPTYYAYKRLLQNISLNPQLATRITAIQTFVSHVSNSNSEIKAYSSWKVDGSFGPEGHPLHRGVIKPTEGIPSVTLNDFCRAENVRRIDLIKIDTDGHEFEILKGALETIAKFRPAIIVEIGMYVMEEKKIDFSFYSEYFRNLNYFLLNIKTGKKITLKNYKKHIPPEGTIDMLALPELLKN